MTDEAPPVSSTTASEPANVNGLNGTSSLKQRRASQQLPSSGIPPHRRGSIFSQESYGTDSSSGRRPSTFRSSTEDLLSPRATGEEVASHSEVTAWHSLPILFAIVPALGGLFSKNGSIFVTDLTLLALAGIYLNWCLVTPWSWYHSAQSRVVETYIPEDAVEEPTDSDLADVPASDEQAANQTQKESHRSETAVQELRFHEISALAFCFLGPLLGSYVLHIVRASLSARTDDLVSNLHLTLFVLCAEIRPLRHAIKMIQARTLFLQKVIREDPTLSDRFDTNNTDIAALRGALVELERSFADMKAAPAQPPSSSSMQQKEDSEALRRLQNQNSALQTQIDALTRAVRRYEKRATATTIQTEARLQDLEARMRETLTLAAAAATYSSKPGVVARMLNWVSQVVMIPLRVTQAVLGYPVEAVEKVLNTVMATFGLGSRQGVSPATPRKAGNVGNGTSTRLRTKGADGYAR